MKTTNNFIREIVKSSVILMIISLASVNTSGQMAFMNPSSNETGKNLYNTGKSDIIRAFADYDEINLVEDEFIEEWMKNPISNYEKSALSAGSFSEVFIEENLEIEKWMTVPVRNVYVDEEIAIEPWMTAPEAWQVKN